MNTLKQIVADAKANNALRVPVYVETLAAAVREHDDALGCLIAFRHAANSLALEAGVIASHVEHSEAEKSVLQDVYFLQLIAEAELRLKSLSVRYEKLRAAAIPALEAMDGCDEDEIRATCPALREALQDG